MNAVDQDAAARLTYESGDWYGVVGPRVVVVLPPAEKARVAAIWTLADEGADLDETLDALISGGLRSLTGFVLVGSDDAQGETRVVLRGAATVTAVAGGESVVLDGASASTWVERTLREVESLVIDVAEVPDGAAGHTIEQGLVRVARVTRGTPPGAGDAGAAGDAPGRGVADLALVPTEPDVAAAPTPVPSPAVVAAPVPVAGPAEPAEPAEPAADVEVVDTWQDEPAPVVDDALEDDLAAAPTTPAVEPLPEPEVVSTDAYEDAGVGAAPDAVPDRDFDDVFDTDPAPAGPGDPLGLHDEPADADADGGLWSPTPVEPARADAWSSAPPPVAPGADPLAGPLSGPDGADDDLPTETFAALSAEADHDEPHDRPGDPDGADHDGQTELSPYDDDEIQLVRPGIPGQPPAPPVTARPVARLVIAGGETVDVDRAVLLGRAPSAGRAAGTEEPLLVRVDSPHQEVSSTHVEVRPGSGADHGTAVVTDLGSTNGTILTQPGLDAEELQPGLSVQLVPGAIIDLGDGVTIQVTRP